MNQCGQLRKGDGVKLGLRPGCISGRHLGRRGAAPTGRETRSLRRTRVSRPLFIHGYPPDREVTVRDESTDGSDAMTKPRISQVLLWILALVTLALFGFFVALVAGAIPVGEPRPPADSGVLARRRPSRRRAGRDSGDKRVRRTTPAPATTTTTTAPAETRRRRRSQQSSSRLRAGIAGSQPGSAPRTGACSTSGSSLRASR